jgi:hypothetical protein
MTVDIRSTGDPTRFEIYEGDEKIGEIEGELPDPSDPADTDPPYWIARVWSQMGTGKEWTGDGESLDEVKVYAEEMHLEMTAERRELSGGARPWTISTPMGGQPKG